MGKDNAYQEALRRAKTQGLGQCDDAAVMASFCQSTLQLLVGAVSPQLVWQGAQAKGLSALELAAMANRGVAEIDDLQWAED
jgi:hypothetical protein